MVRHPDRKMRRTEAVRVCRDNGFPQRLLNTLVTGETYPHADWFLIRESLLYGGLVMFTGDRGTGKTYQASLLGVCWNACGYTNHGPAVYWRLADLLAKQKRHGFRTKKPAPMDRAETAGLLVLDETDELVGTDLDTSAVVTLIDQRFGDLRPTIVVTNREPAECVDTLGPSVLDRIKDGGRVVEFEGGSKR
jgi:DNA replication protein DnaC